MTWLKYMLVLALAGVITPAKAQSAWAFAMGDSLGFEFNITTGKYDVFNTQYNVWNIPAFSQYCYVYKLFKCPNIGSYADSTNHLKYFSSAFECWDAQKGRIYYLSRQLDPTRFESSRNQSANFFLPSLQDSNEVYWIVQLLDSDSNVPANDRNLRSLYFGRINDALIPAVSDTNQNYFSLEGPFAVNMAQPFAISLDANKENYLIWLKKWSYNTNHLQCLRFDGTTFEMVFDSVFTHMYGDQGYGFNVGRMTINSKGDLLAVPDLNCIHLYKINRCKPSLSYLKSIKEEKLPSNDQGFLDILFSKNDSRIVYSSRVRIYINDLSTALNDTNLIVPANVIYSYDTIIPPYTQTSLFYITCGTPLLIDPSGIIYLCYIGRDTTGKNCEDSIYVGDFFKCLGTIEGVESANPVITRNAVSLPRLPNSFPRSPRLDVPRQLSAGFEIYNYSEATCVGDTLQFINTSCGGTLFLWDYGDGSGIDTAINPQHVYAAPGKYIVTLYAYEGNEVDSFSTLQPVDIPIKASFTYSNSEVCVGDTVYYISTSCGAEHYYWNFGDGSPLAVGSTTSHVYQYAGQYFIKLIIENAGVYDTANCFSCINVSITPAIASPDVICQDSLITFYNPVCEHMPAFWTYGDGHADSSGNHIYAQPGWYLLTQTLTSGSLTSSDSKWIEVQECPLPLWFCGLYPNPTPGICNICYASPNDASLYVKITDLLGKQFNTIPLPSGIQQTDISLMEFADGVYFIELYCNNAILGRSKLVLTKDR